MASQGPFNAGTAVSDTLPTSNIGGWSAPTSSATGASDAVMTSGPGVANTQPNDHSIKVFGGGAYVGNDKAANAWPATTLANATYGSSTDNWGTQLTPEQVNSSGFGFGVAYKNGAAGTSFSAYLKLTNFGFTIPSGQMITGITFVLRRNYIDANACFVAGTSIKTPFGEMPIERVKVGDMVDAFTAKGGIVTRPVEAIRQHEAEAWYLKAGDIEVLVTPSEKFLTADGKFKRLQDLRPGDTIYRHNTTILVPVIISEIKPGKVTKVYTIQVGSEHTFFAEGLAVHNSLIGVNNIGQVDAVTATITYTRRPRHGATNHNNPAIS